jgi:hypothetical protein
MGKKNSTTEFTQINISKKWIRILELAFTIVGITLIGITFKVYIDSNNTNNQISTIQTNIGTLNEILNQSGLTLPGKYVNTTNMAANTDGATGNLQVANVTGYAKLSIYMEDPSSNTMVYFSNSINGLYTSVSCPATVCSTGEANSVWNITVQGYYVGISNIPGPVRIYETG